MLLLLFKIFIPAKSQTKDTGIICKNNVRDCLFILKIEQDTQDCVEDREKKSW